MVGFLEQGINVLRLCQDAVHKEHFLKIVTEKCVEKFLEGSAVFKDNALKDKAKEALPRLFAEQQKAEEKKRRANGEKKGKKAGSKKAKKPWKVEDEGDEEEEEDETEDEDDSDEDEDDVTQGDGDDDDERGL